MEQGLVDSFIQKYGHASFHDLEKAIIIELEKKEMTRDELTKKIGSYWTTTGYHIVKLENLGIVKKRSQPSKKRGRPKIYYTLYKV